MFFEADESFILMDCSVTMEGISNGMPVLMSEEDLRKLNAAGIRTAHMFHHNWNDVEPARGVYNWEAIDSYLERVWRCGYKALIKTPTRGCKWFPEDWLARTASGPADGVLSPWNEEAQAYQLDYFDKLCKRYNSDRALVINGHLTDGETFFLNEAAFYDVAALHSFRAATGLEEPTPNAAPTEDWLCASYRKMVVGMQKVLAQNATNEIWWMAHPAIATFSLYGNGNKWIEDFMAACAAEIPGVAMSHIYYTWVQWPSHWPTMNRWAARFGEQVFGGAEYCEGLVTSVPLAIQQGIRGLYIGPLHYFGHHTHVEEWMEVAVRKAYQALQNRG